VYGFRIEVLKAMNELTLASYGKIRQQVRAIKDTRAATDKEQDRLIHHLEQIDVIEKALAHMEWEANEMATSVRRISKDLEGIFRGQDGGL
jgi:erythromycin esterase-like protein